VDHVINFAADMGGMGFIAAHRAECMLNVLINTHLLVAARDKGVRSYYFASSACVYNQELQDNNDIIRLRESDAWPALPEEGYGLEKLFAEEMCRLFRRDFGVPASYARYHNVYGPHGAYEGGREKAPAALCRKVAEAKLTGNKELEIWGDGEQRRSFLYVDDCIDATIRFVESQEQGPLNIGSEDSVTINELLGMIEEIAGIKCDRMYKSNGPQGVRGRCSDNTLAREVLNWSPSVTLYQGLQQTYEWVYNQLASRSKLAPRQR
jgi:nucleoside-diphosphate-sugar epimerase